VVRLLLDRGADVNVKERYYGDALQTASEVGKEEVVQTLLDRDATEGRILRHGSAGSIR